MKKNYFACLVGACALLLSSLAMPFVATAQPADENLVLTLKSGDVVIKLRPDLAPEHVKRIEKLANEGAYDHVIFHRVIDGFMAQTGDVKFGKKGSSTYQKDYAGMGGSAYPNLKAEFSSTPFKRGTVGMARSQDLNSANSQFFICFADAPFLNGQYTVVGEVVKGMDFVDKIQKGDKTRNGSVGNPDEIIKARIVKGK